MQRLMRSIIQGLQHHTLAYTVALHVATKLVLLADIRYRLKTIANIALSEVRFFGNYWCSLNSKGNQAMAAV